MRLKSPNSYFLNIGGGTASGIYNLSGDGQLSAYSENVGDTSAGLNQFDGVNALTYRLAVGYNAGQTGTYILAGGSLSAALEEIGRSGIGNFVQTGGTHTIAAGTHISDGASAAAVPIRSAELA